MRIKGVDVTVYSLAAVFMSALFLCFPELVTDSVSRSLSLCASRVIPAVFPFSVLSSFFIYSGGSELIDRALHRPFYRLFGLRAGASALLCGLLFGFPLGALTAGALYRSGTLDRRQCERLLCFGCCASPTFPVFAVGRGMFGSVGVGLMLWSVQATVSAAIGILLHFTSPVKVSAENCVSITKKTPLSFPEILTASVSDASRVMLTVCGSVTFFSLTASVTTALTPQIFDAPFVRLSISALFEFASGCSAAASAYASGEISRDAAVAFAGFAIGFSGASVICQSAAVMPKDNICLTPFIFCKFVTGIVTAAVSYILSSYIPVSISTSVMPLELSVSPLYIIPSLLFFATAAMKNRLK